MYLFESELINYKNICLSLQKLFGLGNKKCNKIIKKIGFSENLKTKNLSKSQEYQLIKTLNNHLISDDLRKFRFLKFKSSLQIKLKKSFRKKKGLPVRGQRTHTNAKTAKKKL